MGLRIFLINDDNSLKRLSIVKFEKLRHGDPEARLPQYAFQRVRYALVVLQTENRKAVGINMIQYAYLVFNSEGGLDAANLEQKARMAIEMVPPIASEVDSGSVIDASHKFVKRQYESQFKWTPTPEIENAILKAVLGKQFT